MLFIIDIDGTLANNDHRRVFLQDNARDWESFYRADLVEKDPPYPDAQRSMEGLVRVPDSKMVILTGRPERLRETTSIWLKRHYNVISIEPDEGDFLNGPHRPGVAQMFMRSNRDFRFASVYKEGKVKWLHKVSNDKSFVFIDDDERCYDVYHQYGMILTPSHCWKAFT